MNILKNSATVFFLLLLFTFPGCRQDLTDDPIPFIPFPDIIINLSLPEYVSLKSDGGFYSLNNEGVRGIIIYRKSATAYIAYERNCSYHPADACATVEVHSSHLFMFDTCCGSSFTFDDGTPTGGPAWRPLRQYRTYLDVSNLTITAEPLNGI